MEDAGMTTSWQKEKPPCYLWVHSSSLFCSTSTSLLIGIRSWIQLCHPFFATWGKPNSWGLKGRRWEGKICPQSLLQSFQTPSSSSSSPISPPDTHPNPCTLQIKTNSPSLLSSLPDTWNPYWYFPAKFCPQTSLKPKGSASRYVVAHGSPGCHALSSVGAIQGKLALSGGLYCWPWTAFFPTDVKLALKQNIISSTDITYKLPVVWFVKIFSPIFAGVFCT